MVKTSKTSFKKLKGWIDLCTLYFSTRLFRDLNEDVLRWILQFCIFAIFLWRLLCPNPCSELLIFPSKRRFPKLYHRKSSTQSHVYIFPPIRKYKHNFQRCFLEMSIICTCFPTMGYLRWSDPSPGSHFLRLIIWGDRTIQKHFSISKARSFWIYTIKAKTF